MCSPLVTEMSASNEILQKENAVMLIITYTTNLHSPLVFMTLTLEFISLFITSILEGFGTK